MVDKASSAVRDDLVQPITITDSALDQLRPIIEKSTDGEVALRVFVSSGGCSGVQYGMALDSTVRSGDQTFEQGGVKIVVDELSLSYLDGATIDYVDGPAGAGFTVQNPNLPSGCAGCGHGSSEGGCGPH